MYISYLILIFLFIVFINSKIVNAQVSQEWVQRYNGPANSDDYPYSMKVDKSGNVYVTGTSYNGNDFDIATVKYNSLGVRQWVQTYYGPVSGVDQGNSVTVDNPGNVYVTGSSDGSGTDRDFVTIKYNSSGAEKWVRKYNGPSESTDGGSDIAVDDSGNVYVTGISFKEGNEVDFATIKYSSSGVQLWIRTYNGTESLYDFAPSIALDDWGNVYVSGTSYGSGTYTDYATVKYNSFGVQLWVQRYNGPSNWSDDQSAMIVDGQGNVYVTGTSMDSVTNLDFATVKYDSSGNQQWVQRYNDTGNNNDLATCITLDNSGNVLVSGVSFRTGTNEDIATIKYSSSGIVQWVSRFNSSSNSNEGARAVSTDNSNNIYVTGSTYNPNNANTDFVTIKYSPFGNRMWFQRYDGGGWDYGAFIGIDSLNNVYVAGGSYVAAPNYEDYVTVKYSQTIGIHEIENIIPEKFELKQNYPNPFNPTTLITFTIPSSQFTTLTIYNSLGEKVETLIEQQLQTGSYEVEWNGTNFASGIYFYKLTTNNFSETHSMVLLK